MQVTIYRDDADEWRWRAVAENGNVVADSGEGYTHHAFCVQMARQVIGRYYPVTFRDGDGNDITAAVRSGAAFTDAAKGTADTVVVSGPPVPDISITGE